MDFEENEAWHRLSFPAEAIKSLDGRNGIPAGLPEGTHYLYGLSTPKDDEKYWGLRETIGYIAFGQPLSIWEIREGVGHKRLEEILATLIDALEDGRLIAEHEVREDFVTKYEAIPKGCFKVKEDKLNRVQFLLDYETSESGRIRVSYNTAYTVRFRGADVRRLWPQGKTQEFSVSTAITTPRKTYLRKNLDDWYKDYVKQCDSTDMKPSREQDLEAIKKQFPDIGREAARDLRRCLAPDEWRGKGRRKSAK